MPRPKKVPGADPTPSLAYCPQCRATVRVTRDRFITRVDGSRVERLKCLRCSKSFQRKGDYAYHRRRRGKSNGIVVYAYQVADLFHFGHLNALRQAKELGDYLIVGVLTDAAVMAYKRGPVIPFQERMAIVEHCDYVDEVVKQETVDPTDNLRMLKPDIVVHGDDWDDNFSGSEFMRSIDKQGLRTEYYPHQSTTKIIEEIKRRAIAGEL